MKHFYWVKTFVKPLFFVLLAIQSVALFGQAFKTIGYLPYYRFSLVDQIDFSKVTHLNIAFAHPDADGYLDVFGQDITPVVEAGHAAGAEVFIALASHAEVWPDWQFWLLPGNRSEFIHNMMGFVMQHNLQGVDVDLEWSYVNEDYSGFVLELRDSLDQYGLAMSAALPGTYRYPQVSSAALSSFDWINMMVYDLTGPWAPNSPGPHSPYSFALSAINHWNGQAVASSRLTLGVPFYGYDFTDPSNVVSRTFSHMVGLNSSYAEMDQVGQIYYNGRPTITDKTQLALERLGGLMIWELGQDHFGEYSLLSRIAETINAPTATRERGFRIANVYPNPSPSEVFIDFGEAFLGRIEVSDVHGRRLLSRTVESQPKAVLQLGHLPKGMYVLHASSAGSAVSRKLMLN